MKARYKIEIRGNVQGVGFRPFIYKLASKLNLGGYVCNTPWGVLIDVEGEENTIQNFLLYIETEKPKIAFISGLEYSVLDTIGYSDFQIINSQIEGEQLTIIPPDIAVCNDCLKEMYDKTNRRYLYPFINCTNCGPRYSIIESLPYDRPNTSMKIFNMCSECREEYEDPSNRRFHAQPIACPKCGPQIQLLDNNGHCIISQHDVIDYAAELISNGMIIAIKGIGGYQLIVDASNSEAIKKLRYRKHRSEKPFALMFPNIETVEDICYVSSLEKRALLSNESPIVLLKKRNYKYNIISEECAPNNPYLGIMLPYSPLHHLLMNKLQRPIVATSGNLSEEPICFNEEDAFIRLKNIAEYFVTHNRPIVRHVDDSIVRIINNKQVILRRARGYAPFPIILQKNNLIDQELLALGSHIKNSIALKKKNYIILSQHIGDLTTKESYKAFVNTINDLSKLNKLSSSLVLCDLHPEYISTKHADSLNNNVIRIQHHYAHIAACRLENEVEGEALGVSWDGTGYGLDGNIWGGEFFLTNEQTVNHIGQFKTFPLLGGELAIHEPRRCLAGIILEIFNHKLSKKAFDILKNTFSYKELKIIQQSLLNKINSPLTSSVGRLFDSVSSLLNVCHFSTYEGQAAMMLEYIADENTKDYYNYSIYYKDKIIIDWKPIFMGIIKDIKMHTHRSVIAGKFHNTLSHIILSIAKITKSSKVLLSGGCFQNKLLTEKTTALLNENNIKVYSHQKIPPNDGGISAGQIAAYLFTKGEVSSKPVSYKNLNRYANYVLSNSR